MAEKKRSTYTLSKKAQEKIYDATWKEMDRKGKTAWSSEEEDVMDFFSGMVRHGNTPEFYAPGGGGYFGQEFGGYQPISVSEDLEPYFSGSLVDVQDLFGASYGYYAPLNDEFNDLLSEARRSKTVEKMSRSMRKAGGSYGLHPFKRKRTTPFSINESDFASYIDKLDVSEG